MLKRYAVTERRMVEVESEPGQVYVYVNPDEAEKRHLIDDLKLDEHTLNSALDPDELPRLEFEPEHMAVIFKRPCSYSEKDHLTFRVSSAGAFLFKDKLVVVLPEFVPLFDMGQPVRSQTPTSLMLKLIMRTIGNVREHLKVISQISDQLQDRLQTAMENRYLLNMFTLEKSLVYYVNAINANGSVIERLKLNAAKIGLTTEEIESLDDTSIENNQCSKQAEITSNILASLMDARASIVSNNLNILIKTLNIITIGIMVPTLIVSAFSMNVPIPFSTEGWMFPAVLALAALSVGGFMVYWRRRRW